MQGDDWRPSRGREPWVGWEAGSDSKKSRGSGFHQGAVLGDRWASGG